MTDQTLQELWKIKDDIAKEHNYDVDSLVGYLRYKHSAGAARGRGQVLQLSISASRRVYMIARSDLAPYDPLPSDTMK